jgi:protein-S-isoprenylcysteine O-methyltransferase Ste14
VADAQREGTNKYLAFVAINFIVQAVALLASAGSLGWAASWAFLALHGLNQALLTWLLIRRQPDLVASRLQTHGDSPAWDAILTHLMATLGPLTILVVAGQDRRHTSSGVFPTWAIGLGFALVLAGDVIADWAMLANAFFVGRVRIQKERGHRVISSGPYAVVRHPGYLGAIAWLLGTPLALSSPLSLIPAAIAAYASVLRTHLEDRKLQDELAGYVDYCAIVHCRLLPGIW